MNPNLFEKDAAGAFLAFLAKTPAFAENLSHRTVGNACLFGELLRRDTTCPRTLHNGNGFV
jgi:hypothetical protein